MPVVNSKTKLSRRVGKPLKGDADKHSKRPYPPGQHGKTGLKSVSKFGVQMTSKRTLRDYYGVRASTLKKAYDSALKDEKDTAVQMISILESRLDSVLVASGIAKSIYHAKQVISHGHILVNKKCVDIRSYLLKKEDVVLIKETSSMCSLLKEGLSSKKVIPPHLEKIDDHSVKYLRSIDSLQEACFRCGMIDIAPALEYFARGSK